MGSEMCIRDRCVAHICQILLEIFAASSFVSAGLSFENKISSSGSLWSELTVLTANKNTAEKQSPTNIRRISVLTMEK